MLATAKTASSKKSATASRSNATGVQLRLSQHNKNQQKQKATDSIAGEAVSTAKSSSVKSKSQVQVASVIPISSVQTKPVISRSANTHVQQSNESEKNQQEVASVDSKNSSQQAQVAENIKQIDVATTATDNKVKKNSDKEKIADSKQKSKSANKKDEKVYPTSPQNDPAFNTLKKQVKKTADQQQTTNPAVQESQAAQRAAPIASNERMGSAQGAQVAAMAEQEPGDFDAKAFKAQLMERIKNMKLPDNPDKAENFEDNNNIQEINDAASQQVSQEQENTAGPITQATATPPNAELIPKREVSLLPKAPIGAIPASVNANAAMPASRPASQISQPLQENMQEVDHQMANNEITKKQLSNANEPAFTSALGSRSAARVNTEAAPNQFRQQETQSLNSSQQQAENTSSEQLEGMHQGRTNILNTVVGQQTQSGTKNTTERERVSNEINTLYETTKTDVEKILTDLDTGVSSKFDSVASKARHEFEGYVKQEMDAYKSKRYSGLSGVVSWAGDVFTGLPSEVNKYFVEGRLKYISVMDTALTEISNYIAVELNKAKNRIEQGKQNITDYVATLDESLTSFGTEAAENIQTQFDELTDSVNSKQDDLIDSLAQQYNDSLNEVDSRIKEMKAANRGLIDKALDAIVGVIDIIRKLKQLIIDLLSAIQSVLSVIMADPIGFAKKLFTGVRQGFDAFIANIEKHLIGGFVKWLTGAMGPMGITIPDDLFSLKGIFSLVTQVLGFTWGYLRKKAVKLLGEPVVKAMEFGLEMFQIIRSKGFVGVWKYIKDQFTDLKEKIIDSIKQMLITKVIQAGIKWLLSLLIPGAAFIKAAIAIKDFIVFFVESAVMLIPALITAIKALASGNMGMVAKAIENGLGLLIPMVINLFAKLLGLGGLVKSVKKIIKRIHKRIDKAVNKLIFKAKEKAGKLLKRLKGKKQTNEPDTRTGQEKQRDVKNALKDSNQLLDKNNISPKEVKKQLPSIKTKYRLKSVKLKQNRANKKHYIEITNSADKKTDDKKLKALMKNEKLKGIDKYIGRKIFKKNNTEFSVYGERSKDEIKEFGYGFRKQNNKYHIRRKNAKDLKQLHINNKGHLKQGAKSGSSDPKHSNYIPTKKTIKETGEGYQVEYETKTDLGESGPKFKIDISYSEALKHNEDKQKTVTVEATDVKRKEVRGARGKTESAQGGFQNAHLIADIFGGSGRNEDLNIYPSSPNYNQVEMRREEKEIDIELIKESKTSFDLSVKATFEEKKDNSSAFKIAIKKEAKKDNTIQDPSINEKMTKDLMGLVRKDIKGVPRKFIKVVYTLDGKETGSTEKDKDYDNLIIKLLKENKGG